jgi:RNA polymerase sigma-70 factor (ECF subfamily)
MRLSEDDGGDHDSDLLRRTRAGDEFAFIGLYRRHRDPLYRFSLRMLGNAAEAEDVVHDCMVSLLQRPHGYDPARSPLRGYLLGIARHEVWRRLRIAGSIESLDESDEVADSTPDPLAILTRRETVAEVAAAVLALTPQQREAVVLFEYEGVSLAEIASLAGVDVGTVSARLHRARTALRKRLARIAVDRVGPTPNGEW